MVLFSSQGENTKSCVLALAGPAARVQKPPHQLFRVTNIDSLKLYALICSRSGHSPQFVLVFVVEVVSILVVDVSFC